MVFSDGLDLSLEETIGYARLTNTKNPETSSMINNFKSFLNDYKEKNLSIAVIFLPSRLYLYQLMDPEQLSGPNLSNIPYYERDLELILLNYCAEIELLCSSITPDLLNAFKKSLNNLPKSNFFPDNAHYSLEGYKIIGEKAAELIKSKKF